LDPKIVLYLGIMKKNKKDSDRKTVGVRISRNVHEAIVSISRRETGAGRPLSVEDIYNQAAAAWLAVAGVKW